ncbi:hypothetical protein CO046_03620 [Candidatus Peregrinibacteria bacterium CG_4_9_14_0_2_um_filter_53_11]|nr:MAG: hypothetical protein CO046_03620 [Candidatus Peregrinibacteria bacterium CG_4_9_14_0_2_um_filter_53_11]
MNKTLQRTLVTGSIAVVGLAGLTGLAAAQSSASTSAAVKHEQGARMSFQHKARPALASEAAKAAVESHDYAAWAAALTVDGNTAPILEKINAENFDQFVLMIEAQKSGDRETAKTIADSLDLKMPPRHGPGRGQGEEGEEGHGPRHDPEVRATIDAALESGDYAAWQAAVSAAAESAEKQPRILEEINSDNFSTFVELHTAMKAGDRETAKTLAEELGLKGPGRGERPERGEMSQGQEGQEEGEMRGRGGREGFRPGMIRGFGFGRVDSQQGAAGQNGASADQPQTSAE